MGDGAARRFYLGLLAAVGVALLVPPACRPPAPRQAAPEPDVALWEIPRLELMTQRLYRLRYRTPAEEGSARLVLRLSSPELYRLELSDVAGRLHWSLEVDGGEGLAVDHRGGRYCRLDGAVSAAALGDVELALDKVPALLLGRLPVEPAAGPGRVDGGWEMTDASDRRWTVQLDDDGWPAAWSVRADGGGGPLRWHRRPDGGVLESEEGARRIEWRQVVRERATRRLEPSPPPAGFHEERDCVPLALP